MRIDHPTDILRQIAEQAGVTAGTAKLRYCPHNDQLDIALTAPGSEPVEASLHRSGGASRYLLSFGAGDGYAPAHEQAGLLIDHVVDTGLEGPGSTRQDVNEFTLTLDLTTMLPA